MPRASNALKGRAPLVDLIIAVHNSNRPIDRAVASILDGNQSSIRVTAVCHNTPTEGIAQRLGPLATDPRVRLLSLADNVPSPAGPFNLGLDAATGAYTSVMGSDDWLEPGAVDSWLKLAQRSNSDAVITRLRQDHGRYVATPPTRPWRRTQLDGVRDRLSYRSAPLGLVLRRTLGSLRFATDLPVGEDVPYVSQMWFSGTSIAFDRWGPAYVIGSDAGDRVTLAPRSIATELAYLPIVLAAPWLADLLPAQRQALVMKFLRVHIFGAVTNRPEPKWWTPQERSDLRDVTAAVVACSPTAVHTMARADRRLLSLITDVTAPSEEMLAAAVARRRFGRPNTVLTADWHQALAREAPARMMAASWMTAHGW